jgi:YaiO family outer membrane protein
MTRGSRVTLAAIVALVLGAPSAGAQRAPAPARYDVDSAMARATTLRRQNRRPEAAAVMKQARAMAPDRADVRELSDLLEHDIHGGDVLVGVDYRKWRRQLPDWREGSLDARQNTVLGPLVARASHVERGALGDERFELEAYPAFPNGYLALGAGVASQHTVYARTTASAEVFGMLTDRVEGSVGYRRMNFDTGIDLLGGSVSAYAGQFLLGTRVTQVLGDGGTSVQLSARRFLSDDGQYVGAKIASGSVPVALRTPTDFEVRFSQSASAEARFLLGRVVLLSAEGELGREGLSGGESSEYSVIRVGIGLRY